MRRQEAADSGIVPQQLVLMSKDHNIPSLHQYGEELASESATKKLHQKRNNKKYDQKKEGDDKMNGCSICPKHMDAIDVSFLPYPCGFSMFLLSYGDQIKR
ncbi:unnamed protein product [Eruca vesicaria subsp. sativa]|uniref:Uncharacterized protein n=1 Tax=Eruca vesicaria subsp. sativa TaxID=29727 RepID=A0ABC8M2B4_ERUVS|nr:unnamed protein product [Eruca vesicaria subsp. sativa]